MGDCYVPGTNLVARNLAMNKTDSIAFMELIILVGGEGQHI